MKKNIKFLLFFAAFLGFSSITQAENFSLNISDSDISSNVIQIFVLITILSLAPSILIMVTSFTRIIIVFSFLRNAIGLQQSPPNQVMVSLAIFLTIFIMTPTVERSYKEGIDPYMNKKISQEIALNKTTAPFKEFMFNHTKKTDLELFIDIAKINPNSVTLETLPITIIIPAFMISELRKAFEIGFLIFIPFIIIDLLVASILMAMGMMMLPPVMISLPFKVIFFVMIDGWYMICGSLVKGF